MNVVRVSHRAWAEMDGDERTAESQERWYDVAQVEAVMFTDDGTGIEEVVLCSTDAAL